MSCFARAFRSAILALILSAVACGTPLSAQQFIDGRISIGDFDDPLIWLLRDPVALDEIEALPTQRRQLRSLSDQIDEQLLSGRNDDSASVERIWQEMTQLAREGMEPILSQNQRDRIDELIIQIQGPRSLKRTDVARRIKLTEQQRQTLTHHLDQFFEKMKALQKRGAEGEEVRTLENEALDARTELSTRLGEILEQEQRLDWIRMMGKRIDVKPLGMVTFRAPRLVSQYANWLDEPAKPYTQSQVTIVHFFAHRCINCQRNYEHYRRWSQDLAERGVQVVGIHTPELDSERDPNDLRRAVEQAEFQFPVLIDNRLEQWEAWGNSMWPTVYVVDGHGRIRAWWMGELNWQGADGDARLMKIVETILDEQDR